MTIRDIEYRRDSLNAAAPELYEVLSEVLWTFQNLNPQEYPNAYARLVLNVESALAKVRR